MNRTLIPTILTGVLSMAVGLAQAQVGLNAKDKSGAPMANVVASLLPVGKAPPPLQGAPVAMVEQRNFRFDPFVSVVQRGTKARFPNFDKAEHHLKVLSGPTLFEFKLYTSKEPPPVSLDSAGKITLHCLLHSYMVAHIFVVDTPWFAKTDSSGALAIPNVPDGEYELTVDHPGLLVASQMNPAPPKRIKVVDGKLPAPIEVRFDFIPKTQR